MVGEPGESNSGLIINRQRQSGLHNANPDYFSLPQIEAIQTHECNA